MIPCPAVFWLDDESLGVCERQAEHDGPHLFHGDRRGARYTVTWHDEPASLPLDGVCWTCNGAGTRQGTDQHNRFILAPCPTCLGTGKMPFWQGAEAATA